LEEMRCLIHASGTLAGRFNRRHTGKSKWEEAKAVAAAWEAADFWDGKTQPAVSIPPASSRPIPIADAIDVFLSVREGSRIAGGTLSKVQDIYQAASGVCRRARLRHARSVHFRGYGPFLCRPEAWPSRQEQTSWHAALVLPILYESKVAGREPRKQRSQTAAGCQSCGE
jgi:hypothetical protein